MSSSRAGARQEGRPLNQQKLKVESQITEIRFNLEQLPVTTNAKVQLSRNDLAATEERISEANSKRAYTIAAPLDGRISLLAVSPGQVADPKRVQMEIIPTESPLQAQLFVPARAIGFVEPGEKVRVLYDACPYQEFGTYDGTVIEVSQTMVSAAETGPIHLDEFTYKVVASLDRHMVDAQGKQIALQPDMTLKADIVLEKRPLIRWLLEPLLAACRT